MKKAKRPPKKLSFQELEAMNKDDIDHHLEPNSKAKYESGARRFAKFCENQGKDFYPSETNLCHFISVVSRELLPSTPWTRTRPIAPLDEPSRGQRRSLRHRNQPPADS
ncbi:uncharacterized protein MELLADRAFT_113395 [Melampsora larici-populina 98AG31]|uniref:Core-binding (CB) domain-containing protein n=1 Tax=Melampsora larici-populina (strain 98AG31 / pathotype 3-4-7) TaxID=747676 RepID=F4S9Q6_MELLP|nr:uncharacterized protein MELLADRAFT_113395 [Melampsora larici-populina 98AG31]EGF98627.1 hypothetical protein MELLADRAFT_113395 [Melampsora larici-populina 98AG31]